MAQIQNTAAATVMFLGPQVPALGHAWHWWFETRVDYGGPDVGITRPVVFKRLGLSALAERKEPSEIDTALHGKVAFRTPTLLKAYPSASGGTLSLLTLVKGVRVSGTVRGVASADATPLVVSPAASRWPDQELQHALVGRINFPWMRVAQGRMVIAIPADPKNAIAKYLRLGSNGQMLDGVRVALTGEAPKLLQVELTPEGLEFEADMPDPTVDFHPGGHATVKVIVRLEISGAGDATLRLVGATDRDVIDAMEGRLATALAALQVARTPASVRFDVRPAVPSIRWLLEERNGSLRAAGDLAQGRWSVLLDETTVDVRIVSGDFEPAAVATVGARTVMLSRGDGALTLKVNAREKNDHEVRVQFLRNEGKWVPSSETKDMAVTVDLDVPAAQLQALYTQSRVTVPGEQPPFIFLPVRDGWLQAPIPRLPEPDDDTTPLPPQPANPAPPLPPRVEGQPTLPVLSGQLLSPGPAFRAGRSLVVESAAHAEVVVTWRRNKPAEPIEPREVTVRTWATAGELRGYVFAAETSPTAEEGIPNLLAAEAATRDLALVFGLTRTSGRWWDARFDAKDGWHLALQLAADARGDSEWRAWMRDPHAGFVGIVPHTRAARGSARPSPSRDLLPLTLRTSGGGTAKLVLSEAGQARVPDATYEGEVAFAEERVVPPEKPEAIFDTVMPTLPGVQFRPVMAATHPGNILNRWTWTACWRHGLPALDEFFGSIEVPRRQSDEPRVQPVPDPIVTALKPAEMQRTWLLAADRISLGWAQDRFAFTPWLAVDDAAHSVDVVGWAQPYAWQTEAAISLRLGPGADDPALGSYAVGGKRYSLAGALPGIGQEGVAERFAISADHHLEPKEDGKVQVLGMAISSYDDGGLAMDARGLALGSRFTRSTGAVLRAVKFVRTAGEAAREFSLLTLAEPLRIPAKAYLRHELKFYVRDLPVIVDGGKYAFDGSANAIESATGAGGEAFEREHFGQGLHEWRLFESADGRPMRRYDIGWGPLSFVPLRLWKFQAKDSANGASITALWVLGRLEFASSTQPWEPGPSAAPFGPEEPYKAGEIFMMKLEDDNLWLEPVQVDASPDPGAADAAHRLKVPGDAPAGGGMATIRIDAVQRITGGGTPDNPDPMPLLVGLRPVQGGSARLQARLFGDDRTLDGSVAKFEPGLLELRFEPEGDLQGVARASTITVCIASTKKADGTPAWDATIKLGVELRIVSGDARLFSRAADGKWQWMNVSAFPSPGNDLRISHESGAISLDISSELGCSEPLLGWPVDALDVKGFVAQVFPAGAGWPEAPVGGASFLQVEARGGNGFLLRHLLQGSVQTVKLDWRATCTSVIRWPRQLSVDLCPDSSDWVYHTDYVRLVSIPAAAAESMPVHTIELGLCEQPIPLSALGATPEGFGITAPWAFLAAASHRLGADGRALSWQTLDSVEILPAAKLDEPDDAFGFAPRYRDGRYRTRKTDAGLIPHPGVAHPTVAQTGFRDSNMPKAFESWRPVIRASSVTAFIDNADEIAHPRGLVAQVAWLADTAEDGALQGLVLAQCHKDRALDWRFASVDAAHAAKKLLLHRQQREISLPADVDAGELDRALTAALDKGAAQIASQRPVTQAWFELFDKATRAPKPIDKLTAAEMPFFPEALLVFDTLWQSHRTRLEARTILAKGDESGAAVHVRLRSRPVPAVAKPPSHAASGDVATRRVPVQVIALDRERVSIVLEPLTVVGASAGSLLGPEGESGRGRARVRELVKRKMPSPRVIFARSEVVSGRTAWQVVQMLRPDDDFGARVHVESAQPVPASAALGWPSDEGTSVAGKLGPVGGVDAPVLSSRAGFAGRGSTFRLPAWAPGQDGPEALYLSLATHVAFQRPAQVMYTGPAARHLSAMPARLRAPLSTARKEALRKLIGVKYIEQVLVAAICPPALERTSIGDRPGELHAWTASVVVPAEDFRFDPDDERYGRPATSSPVLARQHRAPRAPLLPADADLSLRRRTYVSTKDCGPDGLAEMKLFAGSATLLRLHDDAGEIRCSLEVYPGSPHAFRLGDGWNGQLHLLLDTAPATSELDLTRLAKAGLLPTDPSKSTAQVRVGNERFPLGEWSFKAVSERIVLTFAADPGDALRILAALRAANVDVPVAFDLQLEAQAPSPVGEGTSVKLGAGLPAAIRRWPVRNLSIPLQRAAGARATLAVDLHTVAFGDAAYDRQLAAPTFESPPTTLADGKRLVLVADREEYNLDDTILLAAGVRDEGSGKFAPPSAGAWRLSVHVQPRRKETDLKPPPLRELRFPQGSEPPADVFELKPPSAYALQPRSLVEPGGAPAELEPGDRLVLTVKPPAGEKADSEKYCVLMLRLTDLPPIAPPPAVYSLVTATPAFSRATVAMHACAPLPDVVEYPSLEADLYRGMVQRRALFIWQWATVDEKASLATLVKVDRSGGAQLPRDTDDFVELPDGSSLSHE